MHGFTSTVNLQLQRFMARTQVFSSASFIFLNEIQYLARMLKIADDTPAGGYKILALPAVKLTEQARCVWKA